MVKITKSSPVSQKNGVKKEIYPYKYLFNSMLYTINLTAMRQRLGLE